MSKYFISDSNHWWVKGKGAANTNNSNFELYGAELILNLKGPVAEEISPLILADERVLAVVAVGVVDLIVGLGTLARPS